MSEFSGFGRVLMIAGILLFSVGLVLWIGDRIPFAGRLPGDIVVRREGFRLYFPVVTCIVVSIVLTLVLNLISRR
ncbi:MAG: DUF2905 domain-containing protein [Gemmatimonadetes bacterium]|nr:DUF2905 domain-containing protein [Gemmatimonadota bacterium]MDE3257954.1 DUF2905 domain-containing protein [Gemmatimonadota bacterium]